MRTSMKLPACKDQDQLDLISPLRRPSTDDLPINPSSYTDATAMKLVQATKDKGGLDPFNISRLNLVSRVNLVPVERRLHSLVQFLQPYRNTQLNKLIEAPVSNVNPGSKLFHLG